MLFMGTRPTHIGRVNPVIQWRFADGETRGHIANWSSQVVHARHSAGRLLTSQTGDLERQEQEPGTFLSEAVGSFGALVDGEVVEDDDVALAQGWSKLCLDIGVESRPVHRFDDDPWSGQAIASERRDKGLRTPRPKGACALRRSPLRLRPRGRVIFVVTEVSSMNTRRPG